MCLQLFVYFLVIDSSLIQNGGYINPPRVKRQFRDPYGDWWDKQERRNYGEPVHEGNDILGMFSPEEYTHVTPGTAFAQLGCFVAVVLGICGGAVRVTLPFVSFNIDVLTPHKARAPADGLVN